MPLALDDFDLDLLRMNMRKDYDDYLSSCGSCMYIAVNGFENDYNFDKYHYIESRDFTSQGTIETAEVEKDDRYRINLYLDRYYDKYSDDKYMYNDIYLNVDRQMVNTFNYIDSLNKATTN